MAAVRACAYARSRSTDAGNRGGTGNNAAAIEQREAAAARIPDELVLKTNLIGTEEMVRERLRVYQHAGVNTLQVNPEGETLDERLAILARLVELIREVGL